MEKSTIKEQENQFMDELIHKIYQLCKPEGAKFSLTGLIKEHGIQNKRFIDFLQDCRIIENVGGIGVHARWKWTSIMPGHFTRILSPEVLRNWEIYRTGNPRDLRDFSKVKKDQDTIELREYVETNFTDIIHMQGCLSERFESLITRLCDGYFVVEKSYLFGLIKTRRRIIYKPRK